MCHAARLAWALLLSSTPLAAQNAEVVARERSDFAAWFESAPNSPRNAIVQQPIGAGISLGTPRADVPLEGVPEHRLQANSGRIELHGPEGTRTAPRGQPIRLGSYALTVDGVSDRPVVTVFAPSPDRPLLSYYPYDTNLVYVGRLLPPEKRGRVRLLGLDGIEVDAVEAGRVVVPLGSRTTSLRVRRLPAGGEESELEIYFRDSTNGADTYPAGRFVPLLPIGEGRYRLDFNRARNPFCAYSSAYACPAPWQGNIITTPVEAGERYRSHSP